MSVWVDEQYQEVSANHAVQIKTAAPVLIWTGWHEKEKQRPALKAFLRGK